MSEVKRRDFLAALGVLGVGSLPPGFGLRVEGWPAASPMRIGYAAITWGGDDSQAIADVADVGFKGIQLRASAVDRWGARPGELRDLLKSRGLAFPVLSSGNLKYQPE